MIPIIWHSKEGKTVKTVKRGVVGAGWVVVIPGA